ncbi:MAG: amino acid adenylation domain-containing protein [Candidatus Hinthialibacter antarcticus]|nr:amino acid adenylation domain-containing protein [Candidatus Hinthialibacter antarcticus]
MTKLPAFLKQLREWGVHLWLEDGQLKFRAAKGVMTPERLDELRAHKEKLIAFVASLEGGPIPQAPEGDDGELSNAQRRLWVLCQIEDGSAAYNIPLHQQIEGDLNPAALRAALERLAARHESLRTYFPLVEGEPRQAVYSDALAPFAVEDLRSCADPAQEAVQRGRLHARQTFDLSAGPLYDVRLLRLAERRHVMLFTVHHIISDGVSIGILARDLSALYNAEANGADDGLLSLPVQYRDYAHWQNACLQCEAMEAHRNYWLETLAGELPTLNLHTDSPRPPHQTFSGRELTYLFDEERSAQIQALAKKENVSLFMLLTAWVAALLHRYTQQDDVILGSPFSGRDHADLTGQIGFYINTAPLRLRPNAAAPFVGLLQQAREMVSQAYDHPYPFDVLVNELKLERDMSRSPLFDVCVILQNQDDSGLQMGGLSCEQFFEHPETSKFDLTFCFKVSGGRLIVAIEYNTDLFSDARIQRMVGHLQTIADGFLRDASQPIGRLGLLDKSERRFLLEECNQTQSELPDDGTFLGWIDQQVKEDSEKIAITFGDERISYGALSCRVNALTQRLVRAGLAPGELAGVYLERSPDMVIALLAVLKAGGAYVPMDPGFPQERLQYMLQDSGAKVLLTQSSLQDELAIEGVSVIVVNEIQHDALAPDAPRVDISQNQLAYIIYTSGSTGRPKGVEISHRTLLNFLLSMAREPGFNANDRLLAVTTISFDIAGLELFLPLMRGGEIVLASHDEGADGIQLLRLMEDAKPSVMQATPATWRMLLEAGWSGSPEMKILCGGEALPWRLAKELLRRGASVWNLYGPTETTIWSCLHRVEENTNTDLDANILIGRPIDNTTIYIVDASGQPTPIGVPGELLIGGDGLARGYHNRDELTREKFIVNPFSKELGQRLYRTGDLAAYREDGTIEFLGRLDHQVKVRGFRIETGEIEAVLSGHPGVRQAVVVLNKSSNGEGSLAAYYTADESISLVDIRAWVRAKLPEYMAPSYFTHLDAMPLTPNGKVDRKALPPIESSIAEAAPIDEEPRTELEVKLLELWRGSLENNAVGVHGNFFEWGGHSILATRLLYRIQRDLSLNATLMDLFQHPTPAGFAAAFAEKDAAPIDEICPVDEEPVDEIEAISSDEADSLSAEELELLND